MARLGTLLWLYLAVVGVGAVLYATAPRPQVETPYLRPQFELPTGFVNLAHVSTGAVLRVSSYDRHLQAHPIFAIDGEPTPTPSERWISEPTDRAPWLEVELPHAADVAQVRFDFAGSQRFERGLNMRDYRIQCAPDGGDHQIVLEVAGNTFSRASHAVTCKNTRRVLVEFGLEPEGQPLAVVRLYEVRVIGTRSGP